MMRVRFVTRLWLAAALCAVVLAQGVAARAEGGLLWAVRSGDAVVYLAGAFAAGTGEEYPLPEALEQAFAQSDVLLVKALPIPDQERQALFAQYGVYDQGDGLSKHVAVEILQELVSAGLDPARMERMRPWTVAMLLYSAAAQSLGYSQDQGMEAHFQSLAQERAMEVRGLDSQESLLGLLRDVYDDDPDALLRQCFADLADASRNMPAVNAAVLAGDEELAAALIFGEESESQARYHQALYFGYNEFLADRLEMMLAAGGTYFAVLQAGHLLTDQGLPALLAARGLTVERM